MGVIELKMVIPVPTPRLPIAPLICIVKDLIRASRTAKRQVTSCGGGFWLACGVFFGRLCDVLFRFSWCPCLSWFVFCAVRAAIDGRQRPGVICCPLQSDNPSKRRHSPTRFGSLECDRLGLIKSALPE